MGKAKLLGIVVSPYDSQDKKGSETACIPGKRSPKDEIQKTNIKHEQK